MTFTIDSVFVFWKKVGEPKVVEAFLVVQW